MKKSILFIMVLLFALSAGLAAKVRIGGHEVSDGSYLGAKGFGIGIVLGEINGLSIKNWVSRNNALQFDATWNLNYGSMGLGVAYLIHNFEFIEADNNKFPIYFGIKGWAAFASQVQAGIQVPLGIAWIPRRAPIDVFIQFEPGISVIPEVKFAPGGGIGIRFWLS